MTYDTIYNAMVFLKRVPLSGEEVPTFHTMMMQLQTELERLSVQPKKEVSHGPSK